MSTYPPYDGFRCPLCRRTTYNEADMRHRYCPCCGSADDPALRRECQHRAIVERRRIEAGRCDCCRSGGTI